MQTQLSSEFYRSNVSLSFLKPSEVVGESSDTDEPYIPVYSITEHDDIYLLQNRIEASTYVVMYNTFELARNFCSETFGDEINHCGEELYKLKKTLSRYVIKILLDLKLHEDAQFISLRSGRTILVHSGRKIHISISYTNKVTAVAVSMTAPIGIDIELLDRQPSQLLLEKILTPIENEFYTKCSVNCRSLYGLYYWTYKEAYCKMVGCGLAADFSKICSFELSGISAGGLSVKRVINIAEIGDEFLGCLVNLVMLRSDRFTKCIAVTNFCPFRA